MNISTWPIFRFFNSIYQKLKWVINWIMVYVSPIFEELVAIIKEVQETDLEDDEARAEVFARITAWVDSKFPNWDIPDSVMNTIIELVYQLVKNGKA